MKKKLQALMKSDKQDWGTPKPFIRYVENKLGHPFSMDCCANSRNKICESYIGIRTNFLTMEVLDGTFLGFCNPPYDQSIKFVRRIVEFGIACVSLVPARPDNELFDYAYEHCLFARMIKGRIKFVGAEDGAPFPSALFFFNEFPENPHRQYFHNLGRKKFDIWRPTPEERGF